MPLELSTFFVNSLLLATINSKLNIILHIAVGLYFLHGSYLVGTGIIHARNNTKLT